MQYAMLRLFLTTREIGRLLEEAKDYIDQPRADYLESCLSEKIEFSSTRSQYVYAFVGIEGSVILARVGRLKSSRDTKGPETGFAEELTTGWHAANVLIDISGGNDGQKVAFQNVPEVGNPLTIVQNLTNAINQKNIRAQWHIDVNTITDENEFWAIVQKNQGNITTLTMTFLAPNMFRSREETSRNLKELHKENGVQETQVRLTNRDRQLNPDSERIRENIDYVKKGGGSYLMKSGQKTLYNSEASPVHETIEEEELKFVIQESNVPLWKKLIKRLLGQ